MVKFAIRWHEIEAVIHLAGILGNPETVDNPIPAVETNLLGSLNVFEAAGKMPVVYATVGNKWLRELGTGGYTISKTCVEDFVAMYNKCRGSTIAVVRPVNAYGPGQKAPPPWGDDLHPRKIMPTFINQALDNIPIEVYGDGQQISDMIYVKDVAEALVACLGSRQTWGIGPTTSQTVLQVAKMVQQEVYVQTGRLSGVRFISMPPSEVSGVTALIEPNAVPPKVHLRQGIAETVSWYIEQRGRA